MSSATRVQVVVCSILSLISLACRAATVAEPTFGKAHGFYDSAVSVSISSATAGATIRYTTDGSKPTATYGTVLANGGAVTISKTTCLRAVGCQSGLTDSAVQTQTYIFLGAVLGQSQSQPGYPAQWPTTHLVEGNFWTKGITGDYEMDPDVRSLYGDSTLKSSLKALRTLSIAMNRSDLFNAAGTAVYGQEPSTPPAEKAASVELIDPSNSAKGFQIDCAIRAHSWAYAKRCFRLLFKSPYGPSTLGYPVFENAADSPTSKTGFDKLILRSGTGDRFCRLRPNDEPGGGVHLRDEWFRATVRAMSGVGKRSTSAHLYINGLYWGVYTIIERGDDGFGALWYGGAKSDWFACHHAGDIVGNDDRFDSMVSLAVQGNYTAVKSYLDVNVFCDYLLAAWYAGHGDWPQNNWYAITRNNPAGKTTFVPWDADYTLQLNYGESQASVHSKFRPGVSPTKILQKIWFGLKGNSSFLYDFSRRADLHCASGGALSDASCLARWTKLANAMRPAIYAECARWGDADNVYPSRYAPIRITEWDSRVAKVKNNVIPGSATKFISELKKYGYYVPPTTPVPAAPGNLAAAAQSATSIRLTWTDNSSDETGFKIDRRKSG
ncbi:MAG: CotH kinase family protein, partial [Kiritimatiellae bacterium]|nr:CotH kinase family protein [Kiritimatiellia bacterium]